MKTMNDSALYCEIDASIATLYLNQPSKRNALSRTMWEGLERAVAQLQDDPEVRVLIVRGTGDQAFSAGADISEFPTVFADAQSTARYNAIVRQSQIALARFSKPSIAAIRGVCVGGGCGVALCCDVRLASRGSRFGITPSRLGIAYSFEDTKRLVDVVGPAVAKDILFTGRLLDDEEALRVGLINQRFDAETFETELDAYAQRIVAGSQYSVQTAKAVVDAMVAGADVASDSLRQRVKASYAGEDFREGYRAFNEKRLPKFTGQG